MLESANGPKETEGTTSKINEFVELVANSRKTGRVPEGVTGNECEEVPQKRRRVESSESSTSEIEHEVEQTSSLTEENDSSTVDLENDASSEHQRVTLYSQRLQQIEQKYIEELKKDFEIEDGPSRSTRVRFKDSVEIKEIEETPEERNFRRPEESTLSRMNMYAQRAMDERLLKLLSVSDEETRWRLMTFLSTDRPDLFQMILDGRNRSDSATFDEDADEEQSTSSEDEDVEPTSAAGLAARRPIGGVVADLEDEDSGQNDEDNNSAEQQYRLETKETEESVALGEQLAREFNELTRWDKEASELPEGYVASETIISVEAPEDIASQFMSDLNEGDEEDGVGSPLSPAEKGSAQRVNNNNNEMRISNNTQPSSSSSVLPVDFFEPSLNEKTKEGSEAKAAKEQRLDSEFEQLCLSLDQDAVERRAQQEQEAAESQDRDFHELIAEQRSSDVSRFKLQQLKLLRRNMSGASDASTASHKGGTSQTSTHHRPFLVDDTDDDAWRFKSAISRHEEVVQDSKAVV